jgi:hypothetical protein
VILERKQLRWAVIPLVALWVTGCSGINASHSVTPASFFLPGLIQVPPEEVPLVPDDLEKEPVQLAVHLLPCS